MVEVTLKTTPAFRVAGVKTFIQAVEDFHVFWQACHANGTIGRLIAMHQQPGPITASHVLGISQVERDPQNRQFDFYIATEVDPKDAVPDGCTAFEIPPTTWAIFEARGEAIVEALFEAEMYAMNTWLPQSGYRHSARPELEVYPADDSTRVQYWLPVERPAIP